MFPLTNEYNVLSHYSTSFYRYTYASLLMCALAINSFSFQHFVDSVEMFIVCPELLTYKLSF